MRAIKQETLAPLQTSTFVIHYTFLNTQDSSTHLQYFLPQKSYYEYRYGRPPTPSPHYMQSPVFWMWRHMGYVFNMFLVFQSRPFSDSPIVLLTLRWLACESIQSGLSSSHATMSFSVISLPYNCSQHLHSQPLSLGLSLQCPFPSGYGTKGPSG